MDHLHYLVHYNYLQPHLDAVTWRNLVTSSKALLRYSYEVQFRYLLPHQNMHFVVLRTMLDRYARAIDRSPTGSGKSYIVCALSRHFNLPLCVFAPHSAMGNWKQALNHFGISHSDVNVGSLGQANLFSYSWFSSKRHPLIDKEFKVKELWLEKCKEGVFLVFDEGHNLKNLNKRTNNSIALAKELRIHIKEPVPSRNKLLISSATLYDKEENAINFLKLLRIISKPRFVTRLVNKTVRAEGLLELCDFEAHCGARIFDYDVKRARSYYGSAAYWKNDVCHRYMRDIICKRLSHEMRMPDLQQKCTHQTYVYDISTSQHSIQLMKTGCQQLNRALVMLMKTGANRDPTNNISAFGIISKGLQTMEYGKVECYSLLALSILARVKGSKVIIMVNYLRTLYALSEQLQSYNPLVVCGATKMSLRHIAVNKFQTDPEARLLICITSVMDTGVDLDDKYGTFPRYLLISPSYRFNELHQAAGRIRRCDTKSEGNVAYVCHVSVPEERTLLLNLKKKGELMKSLNDNLEGNMLPGFYNEKRVSNLPFMSIS